MDDESGPVSQGSDKSRHAYDTALSTHERRALVFCAGICLAVLAEGFGQDRHPLLASLAFSGISFCVSFCFIRWLGPAFMAIGLKGKDMSKLHSSEIPEAMGAVCALVYIFSMMLFIPFTFWRDMILVTSGGGNRDVVRQYEPGSGSGLEQRFPHDKLSTYLSAILSLQTTTILGLCDDLFDIRWRHKFFIPAFASIPILVVYYVDFGVTHVVVPTLLQPYAGELLDLGAFYYLYMSSIAIFCPNGINIVAGINGLEVGQSLVIALLILGNDLYYILPWDTSKQPATDSHLFSMYFLLPFVGVSAALWLCNRYPAKVFVGDTYCYFAGTIFAIVGILGHFSKTLMLLFLPQIFNFVFSMPQLMHFIPCPRHRLPRFDKRNGKLYPSMVIWQRTPAKLQRLFLLSLEKIGLVQCIRDDRGELRETSNMTVLNLWLVWSGPLTESRLCARLCLTQFMLGIVALVARHNLALLIYDKDN